MAVKSFKLSRPLPLTWRLYLYNKEELAKAAVNAANAGNSYADIDYVDNDYSE